MFGLFKKKEPMSTDYVANHYSEIISDSIDDFSEMIDKSESFKSIKKPLVKKLSKELLSIQTLTIDLITGSKTSPEIGQQIAAMLAISLSIEPKEYIANSNYYGPVILESETYASGSFPIKEISQAIIEKLSIEQNQSAIFLLLQSFLKANYVGMEGVFIDILKKHTIIE